MSELFLDVGTPSMALDHVARFCARSPYSLSQLDSILFDEMWLVFRVNFWSAAGVWAGWSQEDVQQIKLRPRPRHRRIVPWMLNPAQLLYLWPWLGVGKKVSQLKVRGNEGE